MNFIFLPVGSVCVLNNNIRLLIIGYSKEKKYMGVKLPEGLTDYNSKIIFDINDIKEVEMLGYRNEDVKKFKDSLFSDVQNRYEFDRNGVVVSDGEVEVKPKKSKYRFDGNGVVISDGEVDLKPKKSKYRFDGNGVVLSDGEVELKPKKNKYKFDRNGIVISDGDVEFESKRNKYKFDKYGFVISAN